MAELNTMVSKFRKISNVWSRVEHLQQNIEKKKWQRSYEGIKAALKSVGFDLHTTKEELDGQWGSVQLSLYRKVCVSRDDGVISKPILLKNLFNGSSKLLGVEEMAVVNKAISDKLKVLQPKGRSTF